ncbi:MAG: AtpZ/AtpI family protein [Gemmatimonadales bacterium]
MDERPEGESERAIARKRDELLAEARRAVEGKPRGDASSSLMGLGVQFVATILLCLYAGLWLDRKLGTAPWLLLAGVVVGASASFYAMYHTLMAGNRRADEDKRR